MRWHLDSTTRLRFLELLNKWKRKGRPSLGKSELVRWLAEQYPSSLSWRYRYKRAHYCVQWHEKSKPNKLHGNRTSRQHASTTERGQRKSRGTKKSGAAQRTATRNRAAQRTATRSSAAQRTATRRSLQRTATRNSAAQRTVKKSVAAERTAKKKSAAPRTAKKKRSTAPRTAKKRNGAAPRTTNKRRGAPRTAKKKRNAAPRTAKKKTAAPRRAPPKGRASAPRTAKKKTAASRRAAQPKPYAAKHGAKPRSDTPCHTCGHDTVKYLEPVVNCSQCSRSDCIACSSTLKYYGYHDPDVYIAYDLESYLCEHCFTGGSSKRTNPKKIVLETPWPGLDGYTVTSVRLKRTRVGVQREEWGPDGHYRNTAHPVRTLGSKHALKWSEDWLPLPHATDERKDCEAARLYQELCVRFGVEQEQVDSSSWCYKYAVFLENGCFSGLLKVKCLQPSEVKVCQLSTSQQLYLDGQLKQSFVRKYEGKGLELKHRTRSMWRLKLQAEYFYSDYGSSNNNNINLQRSKLRSRDLLESKFLMLKWESLLHAFGVVFKADMFQKNIYHNWGIGVHFDDVGKFPGPVVSSRIQGDNHVDFGATGHLSLYNKNFSVSVEEGMSLVVTSWFRTHFRHCVLSPYVGKDKDSITSLGRSVNKQEVE